MDAAVQMPQMATRKELEMDERQLLIRAAALLEQFIEDWLAAVFWRSGRLVRAQLTTTSCNNARS